MLPSIPLPNRTKAKLNAGEIPFGVFLPTLSPRLVELCGIVGLDFVVIDGEGGPLDFETAEHMVRAAETVGITPIVRPISHDPKSIGRYLDSGFQGLMVPGVDSAQQARDIVNAAMYPPKGTRGLGLARGAWYGLSTPIGDYVRSVNDELLLIAMIEHANALQELEEIVTTDGIDAFEIGGWDLAASMGHAGNPSHPEVQAAIARIASTVTNAKRVLGDTVSSGDEAKQLIDQGFGMLNCSFPLLVGDVLRTLVNDVGAAAKQA